MRQCKQRPISYHQLNSYVAAYQKMVTEADHRPARHGDHTTLAEEATQYAQQFYDSEENRKGFQLGSGNSNTFTARIFTVEAAKQLACGVEGEATALKLLKMAQDEVKKVQRHQETRKPRPAK